VYGLGGDDHFEVDVPRRDGVVFGGPGQDELWGPYDVAGEAQIPIEIHGGAGNDRFDATGRLYGGPGDDYFEQPDGRSQIFAGAGDDEISGSDVGNLIDAGPGRDEVWGGFGKDVIRTLDGRTDLISCWDGRDRLVADGRDDSFNVDGYGPFSDCETLVRRGEPLMSLAGFNQWEYEPYVSLTYGCPPDGPRRCTGYISLSRRGQLIARRSVSERAGNWGHVDFRLGVRRIRPLLDKDIKVMVRWRDRKRRLRTRAQVTQISEVEYDSSHANRSSSHAGG
jgi:hypothetical protein